MNLPSMASAIEQRDVAFRRIESAQSYPDWKPIAMAFMAQFVNANRGLEWTGEDATDAFLERGLMLPGDMRWFGPIFKNAIRDGLMHRVSGEPARRRHGNGTFGGSYYRSGRG